MSVSTEKPSIFVGSSSEGIEFARAVRSLVATDANVTLWNEGFFSIGNTFIESLYNSLPRFDFCAVVPRPDDLVRSRETSIMGPRDNVVFELGLFMGRLGRERTFIICQAGTKVPSDLAGVATATFEWRESNGAAAVSLREAMVALGPACDSIREAIRDLGISPARASKRLGQVAERQDALESKVLAQDEKIREQQNIINDLVIYSLAAQPYEILWRLGNTSEYIYRNTDKMKRWMYVLLDNGLIEPREGGGWLEFDRDVDGHNLVQLARPTPAGDFFISLRGKPTEVRD